MTQLVLGPQLMQRCMYIPYLSRCMIIDDSLTSRPLPSLAHSGSILLLETMGNLVSKGVEVTMIPDISKGHVCIYLPMNIQ